MAHVHPIPAMAALSCKLRDKERRCIRRRISPARERERVVRPCDCCVVGTQRARAEAGHARRVMAERVGA